MARVDYDRMAPDYVEGRVLPPEGMEPWRQAIRPWLPAEGARRSPVLDLGAGTGQFAAAMRGQVPDELLTGPQLETFGRTAGSDGDRRETWAAVLLGWNERIRISRCEAT